MTSIPVVYDVNVYIDAAQTKRDGDLYSWPSPPPTSGNPFADCVGAANDGSDVVLWVSPHILDNTYRVLIDNDWSEARAGEYCDIIEEIAHQSGGGLADPPRVAYEYFANDTYGEDNRILDLAAHTQALIIVSEDTDLTSLGSWHGTPVLRPKDFASKIDGMRRVDRPAMRQSATQRLKKRIEQVVDSEHRDADSHDADDLFGEPHADNAYQQARERFDHNHNRLMHIVDGWNPDSETMKPRIETWRKNFTILQKRSDQLDEISTTEPTIAIAGLDELNGKLEFALDRLAPKASSRATVPTAHRPAEPTSPVPEHERDQPEL